MKIRQRFLWTLPVLFAVLSLIACDSISPKTVRLLVYGDRNAVLVDETVVPGSPLSIGDIPSRSGYEWIGWCEDASCQTPYLETVVPARDLTLYPHWRGLEHTVVFRINDSFIHSTVTMRTGEPIAFPTPPWLAGYKVGGWYTDADLTDPFADTVMPDADLVLYPSFVIDSFLLTLMVDGEVYRTSTIPFGNPLPLPVSIPDAEGLGLRGWFTQPDGTARCNKTTMPAYDLTLYADFGAYPTDTIPLSVLDHYFTFEGTGTAVGTKMNIAILIEMQNAWAPVAFQIEYAWIARIDYLRSDGGTSTVFVSGTDTSMFNGRLDASLRFWVEVYPPEHVMVDEVTWVDVEVIFTDYAGKLMPY